MNLSSQIARKLTCLNNLDKYITNVNVKGQVCQYLNFFNFK